MTVYQTTMKKTTSFSIGDLKFIDSMELMQSSRESLVNNLYDKEDKFKHFPHMKRNFPEHIELLCQKKLYPYEFVDHISKIGLRSTATEGGVLLLVV